MCEFECKVLEADLKSLSAALFGLPENDVRACFQDGRVASPFVELLAAREFNYKSVRKDGNKDQKGYDLYNNVELINVKCLTDKGCAVHGSSFQGSGRDGAAFEEIKEQFVITDYVIIGDIRDFPTLRLIKIPTPTVLHWIENGEWNELALVPSRRGRKPDNKPKWKISPDRFDLLVKINRNNTLLVYLPE